MRSSEAEPRAGVVRLAAAALVLAGCGPTATPTPLPTPVPVVHVSPAAAPFAHALGQVYLRDHGPLPFDMITLASPDARLEVEQGRAAMLIDIPPVPEGWFATPLGRDALTIIVHEGISARDLDLDQLRGLFAGRIRDWGQVSTTEAQVVVTVPPQGDTLRAYFQATVLEAARVTTGALLASSPDRAAELVANTPGAVGLLPFSQPVPEGARRVRVQGALPAAETVEDGSYPLAYDVVATAPREPTGPVRGWLIWVQGSQGVVAQP